MAEQRREQKMLLAVKRPPLVGLVIFGPCAGVDWMRRRAKGEDDDDHRLVVAAPIVRVESFLRGPAHADGGRPRFFPRPIDAFIKRFRGVADRFFGRIVTIEIRL